MEAWAGPSCPSALTLRSLLRPLQDLESCPLPCREPRPPGAPSPFSDPEPRTQVTLSMGASPEQASPRALAHSRSLHHGQWVTQAPCPGHMSGLMWAGGRAPSEHISQPLPQSCAPNLPPLPLGKSMLYPSQKLQRDMSVFSVTAAKEELGVGCSPEPTNGFLTAGVTQFQKGRQKHPECAELSHRHFLPLELQDSQLL